MTLKEFFSKEYLLNPVPPQTSKLYVFLLIFFSLLIILAIVSRFGGKENKKLYGRYFYEFLTCGSVGLVYLFARYEGLPWLGSRIFLVIIFSSLFIWTMINVIWVIRFIPTYVKNKASEERYLEYLPKAKKRKERKRK